MKKYYEEYWMENKVLQGSPYDIWKKRVLYSINLNGDNYLDIGCGNGEIVEPLIDRFQTYGADISEYALKSASEKGIITKCIDANDPILPYEKDYFDNISCFDVLEHLIDPEKTTNEIYRILKENGVFIVCVPNILNIFNRFFFVRGEFVDVMDVAHRTNGLFSEHIKMFSKKKLEKLINNSGFKILERHYYFPERFNEKKWQHLQFMGNVINKLKIPKIVPSLFALGLLYVCRK